MATKALSLLRWGACRSASRTALFGKGLRHCDSRLPRLVCSCGSYCTRALYRNDVTVVYRDGLPVFSVPLPSRQENCEFCLKPISHTVGDFFRFIKDEDHGIDSIFIHTKEGCKIAGSTTIDTLLRSQFKLIINNKEYIVTPPESKLMLHEDIEQLSDVKMLIAQLYSTLNIQEYQLERERQLKQKLEDLKMELIPLEQAKIQVEEQANKRTTFLSWLGLGMMGLQFGILARLTWWEYSWDIMEPVTYFVTYGTSMAMYAYFVATRQEYSFPDVKDREFLLSFYKRSKNVLDVNHYNRLKDAIAQAEYDLTRLRDPLQLQLPLGHISKH